MYAAGTLAFVRGLDNGIERSISPPVGLMAVRTVWSYTRRPYCRAIVMLRGAADSIFSAESATRMVE